MGYYGPVSNSCLVLLGRLRPISSKLCIHDLLPRRVLASPQNMQMHNYTLLTSRKLPFDMRSHVEDPNSHPPTPRPEYGVLK